MPSVKTLKRISPFIWKPPKYFPIYKIDVIRADGTIDDITYKIFDGSLTNGATNTIGNFEITVNNSTQEFSGVWRGNEVINFYIDYASSATTKKFRAILEKVSYRRGVVKIIGRSDSSKLLDITVTQSYTSEEPSIIIKDIFDKYATDFTYSNVNTSTATVTVNWYQKPFWECVQELCDSSGFDCYIDSDLDCHFFESGSVENITDAAVHNKNLFDIGDFAYDYSEIKNRIIVYGGKLEGMDIIATAEDSNSIEEYGLKEKIINDNNISTDNQAQERAEYELSRLKDPPLVGDVTALGLPTIQPGEKIFISAPQENLDPGYYIVLKYKHEFGRFMRTVLTIEKETKQIPQIIKDRIGQENNLANMPNTNEMQYSWIETFNNDTGTHNNTEITDGVLKLQAGESSGYWISNRKESGSEVVSCELRINGSNYAGTNNYVSSDDGNNWQKISSLNTQKNLSPPGNVLRLKIELNSANTEIDASNLLYKS